MVWAHFLFQLQARRLGSRRLHFSPHLNPFLSLVLTKNQRLVGVSPLRLHVPVWSDADLVSHPSLGPLTSLPMEPELQLVHEERFSELTCGSGRKQVLLKTGLEAQLPVTISQLLLAGAEVTGSSRRNQSDHDVP